MRQTIHLDLYTATLQGRYSTIGIYLYAPFPFFHSLCYSPGLKQHVYEETYTHLESQQSHSSSTELKKILLDVDVHWSRNEFALFLSGA